MTTHVWSGRHKRDAWGDDFQPFGGSRHWCVRHGIGGKLMTSRRRYCIEWDEHWDNGLVWGCVLLREWEIR